MKIAEALNQIKDYPVTDLNGKIINVWAKKDDKDYNGKPQWSQNIQIEDETGKCFVKVANRNDVIPPTAVGQEVHISAIVIKGSMQGAKINRYTSNGKEFVGVRVTPSGFLSIGGIKPEEIHKSIEEVKAVADVVNDTANVAKQTTNEVRTTTLINDAKKIEIRGYAMSYAKDLTVSGIVKIENILAMARCFTDYIAEDKIDAEILNEIAETAKITKSQETATDLNDAIEPCETDEIEF